MEYGLETVLNDKLCYGKYDYKNNKDTENNCNGYSNRTLWMCRLSRSRRQI